MNRILVFALVIVIGITNTYKCDEEKHYSFKYDGMEQPESVKKYFDIAMDEIKHKDGSDSIFIFNGNVEQKLDLDDTWKSRIIVYRSDTVDGEYIEYKKFPALHACTFMKTFYKYFLHSIMKDCSNLPDPDACPITKEHYKMTNCEFDANVFRHMSRPGFYKINADLLENDEVKTGIVVRGSVSEKQ